MGHPLGEMVLEIFGQVLGGQVVKELGDERVRIEEGDAGLLASSSRRREVGAGDLCELEQRRFEGGKDGLNLGIEGVRLELVPVAASDRVGNLEQAAYLCVVARRRARGGTELADELPEEVGPLIREIVRGDEAHRLGELRLEPWRHGKEERE